MHMKNISHFSIIIVDRKRSLSTNYMQDKVELQFVKSRRTWATPTEPIDWIRYKNPAYSTQSKGVFRKPFHNFLDQIISLNQHPEATINDAYTYRNGLAKLMHNDHGISMLMFIVGKKRIEVITKI